ncbi:MAG: hypothetical protein H0V67_01585 [Geodermatophilaceae bacterium]|nr:hypothetical protein [Geodermatophilaceae bacterium]
MPSGGTVEAVLFFVLFLFVIGLPLFGGRLIRVVRRQIERRSDRRPPPPSATRPTGQLVDDLRRLSRSLAELPAGAPWARHHGTQMAYDDVLVELCRALEVEHDLGSLSQGLTRDMERLRVEDVLYGLGLRIHTVGT